MNKSKIRIFIRIPEPGEIIFDKQPHWWTLQTKDLYGAEPYVKAKYY